MFLVLVTTTTTLLLCWLYTRWCRTKRYWAKKGVPHLPPHPIMGSLTFLQKQNPGIWMRDMYNRFRSPYIGIWLFWRPALIINSPDIARRVLVKDATVFRDRFLSSGQNDPIGGLNLFTVNDPIWSSVRRRLTAVFTASKLRIMAGFVSGKSKELLQRISNEMKEKGRVNLRMMFADYTTDIIGTTSFGVSSNATLTGESELRTVTKDFMKFSVYRGLCWSSIFFYPELVDVFGFTMFPKSATDYFRRVYKQMVAQRGGYDVDKNDHGDLLDALRNLKNEFDADKEDITEDTLIAQAAIFLQAGFDTTASALAFCAYELAHNTQAQEKLFNELNEAKIKNQDFEPTKVMYLLCVFKETMRKYTAMGWLDRIASRDYRIDDKLVIPAGTPVYVNAVGMHHDPDLYPEPLKFDPDRFLPPNGKNMKPFTFLPFGEGPRSCIGRRFALQNFTSAISNIVLNYKIQPLPGMPLPSEVQIEKKGLFYNPGQQIFAKFVPRNKD